MDKVYNSTIYKKVIEANKDVLEYVEQHAGKPIRTLDDLFGIYQTLNAEDYMNLTLPTWTKTIYPQPISSLSGSQCDFENYNDILKRLNGGNIMLLIFLEKKFKLLFSRSYVEEDHREHESQN